jgi:hypothetical protein
MTAALVDFVQAAGTLLLVPAAVLVLRRRRLVRAFTIADAFAPDTALPASPARGRIDAWLMARLAAAGVFRQAGNAWWLDRDTWDRYRTSRRRRGLCVAAALLALVALLAGG